MASAARSSLARSRTRAAASRAPVRRSHHPGAIPSRGVPANTLTTTTGPSPRSTLQHDSTASSKCGESTAAAIAAEPCRMAANTARTGRDPSSWSSGAGHHTCRRALSTARRQHRGSLAHQRRGGARSAIPRSATGPCPTAAHPAQRRSGRGEPPRHAGGEPHLLPCTHLSSGTRFDLPQRSPVPRVETTAMPSLAGTA
jgi:hypothetical protein